MSRFRDLILSAIAPAIWGSTYMVTTQFLPAGYPMTAAMLRALPAGVLLLMVTRELPRGRWIIRSLVLGALNFTIFWWLLFVAAYHLPGGLAATLGAVQPLIVLGLSKLLLDQDVRPVAVAASIGGVLGVGLLVLTSDAVLDWTGILAALAGAISMAFGTVLSRKFQAPVPALTFTAWQLTAGGLLLLPLTLATEPALPRLDARAACGFVWLSLIGGAVTYYLWFRGIARLGPARIAPLGLFSPIAATALGVVFLDEKLSAAQVVGAMLVLVSVWLSQLAQKNAPPP